jgi:hypothetical protein
VRGRDALRCIPYSFLKALRRALGLKSLERPWTVVNVLRPLRSAMKVRREDGDGALDELTLDTDMDVILGLRITNVVGKRVCRGAKRWSATAT